MTNVLDQAVSTRRRNRVLAVAGAVIAAVAVWVVGEPVLGHDMVVTQSGQAPRDLGVSAIVFFALTASLLGWALLAVLERFTSLAGRIWTAIALIVLAVSFLPLIGVEASSGTKVVLALSHLAVGAILIPMFLWTTIARENS